MYLWIFKSPIELLPLVALLENIPKLLHCPCNEPLSVVPGAATIWSQIPKVRASLRDTRQLSGTASRWKLLFAQSFLSSEQRRAPRSLLKSEWAHKSIGWQQRSRKMHLMGRIQAASSWQHYGYAVARANRSSCPGDWDYRAWCHLLVAQSWAGLGLLYYDRAKWSESRSGHQIPGFRSHSKSCHLRQRT